MSLRKRIPKIYSRFVKGFEVKIIAIEKQNKEAEVLISRLWLAGRREGWEKGPTPNEVHQEACGWIYNRIGDNRGSATEHMTKLATGKQKP